MPRARLLLLAPLLAACSYLTPMQSATPAPGAPPVTASPATDTPPVTRTEPASAATPKPDTPAAPLDASASASATSGGVTVTLIIRNAGTRRAVLTYGAQANHGACGNPPYVLVRGQGGQVITPATTGRLSCPQLRLSRTLGPGETITLNRTLPPLQTGTYTVTAWFDGLLNGQPNRTQAPPVRVAAR